jgi:hypothetical protein
MVLFKAKRSRNDLATPAPEQTSFIFDALVYLMTEKRLNFSGYSIIRMTNTLKTVNSTIMIITELESSWIEK